MNNYNVYMLKFPDGKVYIGLTQQNPKRRWRGGAGYSNCQPVKQAIYKTGWKNVQHIILKKDLSKQQAEYYEHYYITEYNSNNAQFGYNLTSGGITNTKRNISSNTKTSNGKKGIIFTKNHKNNISKSLEKYFKDPTNNASIEQMKYNNMISQPTRKQVRCIETNIIYPSSRNAGKSTNIDYRRILDVCHKKYGRQTAGGYHWEFVEGDDD